MPEVILIIDMLKGFIEPKYPLYCGKDAESIVPNIVNFLKNHPKIEKIYICDRHKKDDLEFLMFPPHCIEETEEAEIIDELKKFPGIIIYKTRFSGFFKTNLEEVLENLNPSKIYVCGVCTDICVLYTVADLRFRDYEVYVLKDCVASFDKEAHMFALKHMERILGAKII